MTAQPPATERQGRPGLGRGLGWIGRALLLLALVTFVIMLCAPRVRGQEVSAAPPGANAELDAQVRKLSAELRCPVCQGLSLADSPSELSQEMKNVVRAQLESGKSPDEVKAYFVGRYGEWILLEPKPHGWNLLVYALPLLLVLAGLAGVFFLARRWTLAGAGGHVAESQSAPDVIGTPGAGSRE